MVLVEFLYAMVSDDLVGNSLDYPLVGETVIAIVEHRYNKVFVDTDTHDFACVDDSLGYDQIFGGGRYISTRVIMC